MNRTQKLVLGIGGGVCLLALVIGAFVYGLYFAKWEMPWFRSVAGPFPVARFDSQAVTYNDYLTLLDSGRTFLKSPAAQSDGIPSDYATTVKPASYERAIRIKVIEAFAKEQNVSASQADVDEGFDNFILRNTSSTRDQAVSELQQYFGWTEGQFKVQIMEPALLEDLLFQKYQAQGKTRDEFDAMVNDRLSKVKRYLKF